ncbi:acyclic terpene utilization AtuA family protein [Paenisporosarcina indica]|uniref:acyclic terpene utilization AtuA family protein n=1 Tax=Paenisporosarcina indica TaxID=650093 RepID=UPI001FE86206|nr:acyclic terpene utilization AtuA family protein [Paenisporosarcina indica]
MMKKIRIGSGAGYAGDRLEPALVLLEKGKLDYIGFECLAERTIAIAQQQRLKDPEKGYNELLEYRMEKILPLAYKNKVKVITNMGAANPESALEVVRKMAEDKNLKGMKIAAVLGDNIFDNIEKYSDTIVWETGKPLNGLDGEIVSANAYLGMEGIVKALQEGADVIITGRVSDPALFLAPLVYEFGWFVEDYDKIGKGILIGHLLECASQVTGGYYAEPGKKDVKDLWNLGFPIAEVDESGDAVITKVEGTGGTVTTSTCTEQLLYEIHNPEKYFTPDCVADFSKVTMEQVGKDKVAVSGATGREKTDTLKASIGYKDGFIGEGEMSYGGPGCLERAKLAAEIVRKRLEMQEVEMDETRIDFIGINSIYRNDSREIICYPEEVRLRFAARTKDRESAVMVGNEVETLYTNGPCSGGGAAKYVKEIMSVASILVPRDGIKAEIICKEVL